MEAFVLLGSNIGLREQHLSKAIKQISALFGAPEMLSHIYASESWGFHGQEFLNQLVVFSTTEHPVNLLRQLLEIEQLLGRSRHTASGYVDRIIDIDLLYLGNIVHESPELILPHPRLHLRRFTLLPLVELAPQMVHPVLNKTHQQILSELEDNCRVTLRPTEINFNR
ncbi:MAG TPA: 2-amino-4-hydroxy-6-hydroxymethyldihydropteridine diphosphokinase [Bacteroidales bacterium]|nr:2-amino-4-hydroxy-6-hydroxymethyldihydropteridine diphosphokinase [Bacteroidales bacterium]